MHNHYFSPKEFFATLLTVQLVTDSDFQGVLLLSLPLKVHQGLCQTS